ncbi:MAG: Short-chain dehydrogenase/reductase SDR [Methanoculleus marisnigri]|jgi:Dehydrogenases with different specificities (related to short-chain alcohol dehydrogenases)|uniref:Short-chain dehydrogenase/reductase SDR n=1 Tax=Methanoculleus marisnigri TaxID=2198 RepID=A0A101IUU6_9EURY|nr:MAG: Short-chain dehydrogenase/reductase SDR [Methanoculleus marisnigri]
MTEQTILVTGSTDGIGKATAHILSRQGHRVLLHGRDRKKGRGVLAELEAATGSDRLSLFIADLSVQEQVRDLAREVGEACDRLDVLVNNAGVFMPEREVAPGGIEMTFAVNFLAGFLLTHELLGLLERSTPSRIVNVASIAHRSVGSIDWGNLPGFSYYDPYDAYAVSKVGNIAFTARLARALEGTGVTANSLHPGVIDTKLLRAYIHGRDEGAPPEQGAEVVVHLAVSPDAGTVNGGYFEETRWTQPSSLVLNPKVQDRFWEMGLDLTGIGQW